MLSTRVGGYLPTFVGARFVRAGSLRLWPLAAVLLSLLLSPSGQAWAQACLTCRTEKCPDKEDMPDWCGTGRDPHVAAKAVVVKPRPRPTAPASSAKQPELLPRQLPGQSSRPSAPASGALPDRQPASEPSAPAPPRPIYKKWWFWTAILGSAAVVGTVAGVLAYKPWELPDSSNIHNVGDRL